MQCATAHGYAVFTHDLDFATMLALSGARGPIVLQVRGPNVLPAAVAGHADLAAAGLEQGALIEVGPVFDQGFESGGHGRWPGERDTHGQTVLDAY